MSVNSPPQLDYNPLTEGFIYSPLHPDRIDFTEEGIKTDKRTKNEKHFIGETLSFFRLQKKTALELIIAEYCGYDPSIVFWKGLNISYLSVTGSSMFIFFLCSALGYKYVYPQLLERFHLPNDADTEELVERGLAQTSELLEVIENFYLQDHPFLCGSELTVADSYVATILCQAELVELDFILWPRLCAWMVKVKGQEHWVEVHSAHADFLQKVKKVNVT